MDERLFDILDRIPEKNRHNIAFKQKYRGEWRDLSYNELIVHTNNTAMHLIRAGLKKGEAVGTIMNNRPEWNILDFAIMKSGGVHVSLFPTFSENELEYTLNHARVKFLFVSSKGLYHQLHRLSKHLDFLEHTFYIKSPKDIYCQFEKMASAMNDELIHFPEISPDDACTVLYTSGTSGIPKGVVHNHKNFNKYAGSFSDTYELKYGEQVASFLPLCHGFERSHIYYYLQNIMTVNYADAGETLLTRLNEINPVFFTAVPVILQNIKKEIEGDKNKHLTSSIRNIGASGALMPETLYEFFKQYGINVLTSYGLTECLGVSANTLRSNKASTSGKPLSHVRLKIKDGVILIKSDTLTQGYLDDAQFTCDKFTDDGFFITEDLGSLDKDGCLTITGRVNDVFKTQNGRFFHPVALEKDICSLSGIKHVIIIGAGKPFLTALINIGELNSDKTENLRTAIDKHISDINQKTEPFLHINKYLIVHDEWSTESGEFTHNNKIKRTFILQKYKNIIDNLYKHEA